MTSTSAPLPRDARAHDIDALLALWALLFEDDAAEDTAWHTHARTWFEEVVDDRRSACLPVIEVDGAVVAGAVGTLEVGVPNPHCPRGRGVRLANVVTAPEHRGRGYGTVLVGSVVDWARSVQADRLDLSATPEGRRIYERSGFVLTTAPRMKLVL